MMGLDLAGRSEQVGRLVTRGVEPSPVEILQGQLVAGAGGLTTTKPAGAGPMSE